MAVIDLKNCTVKFKDGGANEVTVKVGTGNVTFTERRNMDYLLDAGSLDTVREGDEVPVEVSIDMQWEYIKGVSGTPTPVDALKKEGGASAWVTSSADACEPYAVDIEITNDNPCSGSNLDETILISDYRWEELNYDIQAGQISTRGRANITRVTATRS